MILARLTEALSGQLEVYPMVFEGLRRSDGPPSLPSRPVIRLWSWCIRHMGRQSGARQFDLCSSVPGHRVR